MNEIENNIIEVVNPGNIAPLYPEKIYTIGQISDDVYALDSKNVLEIIKFVELTRPERLPSHIAGLFEYDGKIINIVDIRSVLNIEPVSYDINSMIVILNYNQNIFGVIVNSVPDIVKVDITSIQPTPYSAKHGFIDAICSYNEKQCGIINIAALSEWVKEHPDDIAETSGYDFIPKDEISTEILHKRKLDYIEKSNKNPYVLLRDKDEFVSFLVGEDKYCIKMCDIRGFYKLQETKMTSVPCTPDFILGLVNIKGDFICVIDIKSYFHSQKAKLNSSGTIIVLDSDEFKIGILADSIGDNIQIKPEEIKSLSKQELRNELMQHVKDGEIRLIINVSDMLANDKLFIR